MKLPAEACRKFADSFPCLVAVSAILNADFLWLSDPGIPTGYYFLAPLPLTLIVWPLLGSARTLRLWMLPTVLLLTSILLSNGGQSTLPDRVTGAELRIVMTDSSLCGGRPSWLPNAPAHTLAQVREFRYTPSDNWRAADGTIFVRLPRSRTLTPGCGDLLQASGTLEPVGRSAAPAAFDFTAYARIKGVSRIFTVRDAEIVRRGSSPLRRLYDLRGDILEVIGTAMGAETRAISSALLFGMKQGIDAETRSDFLRSGTIHVLCVSGLHIALFASILLLILRPVPFAARWFLILGPILLYALSTGMQGPAFRAFVMFAVWALLKAFHYRTRAMNTIALAAVLLILWNPLSPLDLGFQYSFLCVAFLLICADFLRGIRFAAFSRWKYRFTDPGPLRRAISNILIFSFGASVAAYLASFGVSMLRQGLFSPYAVPAYLLMSPVAWLCFAVFVVGLFFCWIPGVLAFCGVLMSPLLHLLRSISAAFAEAGSLYTQPSPWWGVLIYLILLAMFFGNRSRRRETGLAVALAAVFTAFLLVPFFQSPELLIRHGGGTRPMLIFTDPAINRALVINIPDYEAARDAVSYLHSRGVSAVEELFCDSARRESCGGAAAFLNMIPVRNLYFAAPVRLSALYARNTQKRAAELGMPAETLSASAEYRKTADGFSLRLLPPWNGILLQFRRTPDRELLEIRRNGIPLKTLGMPLGRDFRWERITLPEYAVSPVQQRAPSGKIRDRMNGSYPRNTP